MSLCYIVLYHKMVSKYNFIILKGPRSEKYESRAIEQYSNKRVLSKLSKLVLFPLVCPYPSCTRVRKDSYWCSFG